MRLLRDLAFPPRLATADATARARIVHGITWVTTGVALLILLILMVEEPETVPRRLGSVIALLILNAAVLQLNAKSKVRFASWLYVAGLVALVGQRALTSGGLTTPSAMLFLVTTMIAGLLLDTAGAAIVALATVGFQVLMVAGRTALPQPELTYSPLATLLYSVMALGVAVLVIHQITLALGTSLRRAQAEAEARSQTERRLRLAVEAGGFATWDHDLATRTFGGNAILFELYGIGRPAADTVDYETWLACVHPDDRPAAEAELSQIREGAASAQAGFRVVHPDGTVRHIESAAAAVFDDRQRLKQIVGVHRDVTARNEAERQRVRLLRDLGERIKELSLLHAAARMLQLDRPSHHELFQELVALIPPAFQFPECCEARISMGAIRVATAAFREVPSKLTTTFRTSEGDGAIEVVYLEARPPSYEGPFLAEERTLLESLAEMITGYAELRTHQNHLSELVSQKTRELRIAVAEADRANQAKSTFLATMSHEIRTPMNAMLGYAQLLRRDSSLTAAQRDKIETILASGDHLLTLINNVLEMSKIEAGRATLSLEPFDLHTLLESVQQMFRELARAKGLALVFTPFDGLPRSVEGDPGKVRQVLINLLSNAMKFSSHGEVRVASSATAQADGRQRVTIEVADRGPGISPADLARLFTAFEQAPAGHRAGGTGLGLSISREFARLMEGDLTVASEVGVGSVFSFSFRARPISGRMARVDEPSKIVVGLGLQGPCPRVLVVDDQAENRALLDELLTTIGFETRVCTCGEDAIAQDRAWSPDLILMDLRMPGMGGVQAIRQLRAQGSKATIVALTASGLDHGSTGALEAGAQEILWKPYREAHLLERIGRLLALRYVYQESTDRLPASPIGSSGASTSSLAELLSGIPQDLIHELRDAALEARPARIERLAEQVAVHSAEAAATIMSLTRNFAYDALTEALADSK